jgi:hypothetical protein
MVASAVTWACLSDATHQATVTELRPADIGSDLRRVRAGVQCGVEQALGDGHAPGPVRAPRPARSGVMGVDQAEQHPLDLRWPDSDTSDPSTPFSTRCPTRPTDMATCAVQGTVLDARSGRRDERDLVITTNVGGGNTPLGDRRPPRPVTAPRVTDMADSAGTLSTGWPFVVQRVL